CVLCKYSRISNGCDRNATGHASCRHGEYIRVETPGMYEPHVLRLEVLSETPLFSKGRGAVEAADRICGDRQIHRLDVFQELASKRMTADSNVKLRSVQILRHVHELSFSAADRKQCEKFQNSNWHALDPYAAASLRLSEPTMSLNSSTFASHDSQSIC